MNCRIKRRQDGQGHEVFIEFEGLTYYSRLNYDMANTPANQNYHIEQFKLRRRQRHD